MKIRHAAIIVCILIASYHEYLSFMYSSNGYWKGIVVDKYKTGSRSSTFRMVINFNKHGDNDINYIDTVSVTGYEYLKFNKGASFSTQMEYAPIIGAAGTAYVGDTGFYVLFSMTGAFSKLFLIGYFVFITRDKSKKIIEKLKLEW